MLSLMTSEVILYFIKKMRLHNVSFHINFYQNWFINKYASRKKAKISESRSFQWDIEKLMFLKITSSYLIWSNFSVDDPESSLALESIWCKTNQSYFVLMDRNELIRIQYLRTATNQPIIFSTESKSTNQNSVFADSL